MATANKTMNATKVVIPDVYKRQMIAKLEFGDALKLLMNDRDMSVEKMESESGLSVSTVKRLRAGQERCV